MLECLKHHGGQRPLSEPLPELSFFNLGGLAYVSSSLPFRSVTVSFRFRVHNFLLLSQEESKLVGKNFLNIGNHASACWSLLMSYECAFVLGHRRKAIHVTNVV